MKDIMMRVSPEFKDYLDAVRKHSLLSKKKELTYPKLTKQLVEKMRFTRIRL